MFTAEPQRTPRGCFSFACLSEANEIKKFLFALFAALR
jgi:hypothetical protein